MALNIRRPRETGALKTRETLQSVKEWTRAVIFRGFLAVAFLYGLSFIVSRTQPPVVIGVAVISIMGILCLVLFAAMGSYLRITYMRNVLSRTEWQPATGAAKMLYVGPFPLAMVAVADVSGGDGAATLVHVVSPRRFARRLPNEVSPLNMRVATWKRTTIFARIDGSNPCFGFRLRGKKLRQAVQNLVHS